MNNKEKIVALYKYIEELCALKYRIVTDVEKQYWTQYLKDIPIDTDNISVFYRDKTDEYSGEDTAILEVRKPDFQRCPEPPTVLAEWLESGWDRYTSDIKIKNVKTESSVENSRLEPNEPERFSDSKHRLDAFEKWSAHRMLWVEKQRLISRTRRFFSQLFQIYTDLERESETLEMMVGNGVIKETGNSLINHPILLKRVKLQFDAKKNLISIHDTDTEPELYTLLLQDMQEINHSVVKQLKEDLYENCYHPLDRNDTPDYIKILTHRLCSDSKFIADENDRCADGDRLVTTINPVFFVRKRIDGTLKAIEEIIRNIESTGYIPKHLLELVDGGIVEILEDDHEPTIEEQLASSCGESLPILLAKEANREQLEIAERIEQHNAVLVQGPPGTGKTHTIANLLGHFLAQGKSVLVTSHTKKALSVLKDKISDGIKDLCVSVLDDTNLDMVRSVDGISDYMSRHTAKDLKRRFDSDMREREDIIRQLADVRKKIYTIKYREFEPIVYNGDSYSPTQAAAFVKANAEELSYIPGKVKLYHPMPVITEKIIRLYQSNGALSEKDEHELQCEIPSPNNIMSPSEFTNAQRIVRESKESIADIMKKLGIDDELISNNGGVLLQDLLSKRIVTNPQPENLRELFQYVSTFKNIDGWMIHAAADGCKGGGYCQRWEKLISAIEATSAWAEPLVAKLVGFQITISPAISSTQLSMHLEKMSDLFQKKGKITKFDLLFNKSLKIALNGISINGKPLASEKDCLLVRDFLVLQEKRNNTSQLWNELIAKHGTPEFFALGEDPEHVGRRMIPTIQRYLGWHQNEYAQLIELVERSGFNAQAIFCEAELDSELARTQKILDTVQKQMPLYIQLAECLITLRDIEQRKNQIISILTEDNRKSSSICNSLVSAILDSNQENYEYYYDQLSLLYAKYSLNAFRKETLAIIEPLAPEWANEIRNRIGINGSASCPDTIEDAWKWKQFAGIIDSITAEPFEELQHKAVMLSKELRRITANVATSNAWYHLLLRTERNLSMRQALMGWKLTIKKIGKGTGKNAPALKKQARELMAECQVAVPAWIMTVNKAMESLDPANNSFDVVIIDEASQSDISTLGIVYLAKKVIIVGDDKQVSPMAVGVDIDKMNALRDMYIKDIIPGWHLYDAKTSLYDIAATTFQPLMLKEHFRCHPDIIGYSNRLSYDYKIKPLRDAGTCKVSPPVVKFRVDDGMRSGRQKTNVKEAESIVALMMACIEQKEYHELTFGAISLLGDEQAQKIQQIILQRIDPTVIEQRRIMCGNASHFQGDERDVVFLSIVDSNEDDGPLNMAGEGSGQSRKQRYNVAASRAKDQLWVVHSLDYTKDLKSGDLRRDLLEYAENPQAFARLAEMVTAAAESPFEEAVGKSLVAAGYHIVQQWLVGAYRIDMVVLYNGNSVAIECDGELFHSGDEKIRADMERQTILERIGWRFIRIRGSEYYRNPESTIERVKRELANLGIHPETMVDTPTEHSSSALLDRINIRAAQILDEWSKENEDLIGEIQYQPIITSLTEQPTAIPVNNANAIEQMTLLPTPAASDPISTVWKSESSPQTVRKAMPGHPQSLSETVKHDKKEVRIKQDNLSSSKGLTLIETLKVANIDFIDNRVQSGIIWVPLIDEKKGEIEAIINGCGLRYSFEKRGAMATSNKPTWRIMSD